MATEQKKETLDATEPDLEEGSDRSRQRSTIVFPYDDLGDALQVAKALGDHGGLGSMDQIAAWMAHDTVNSGAFRLKITAARVFGLIEVKGEQASLTHLGNEIVRSESEARASAVAFLNVPLFRSIYEKYKGRLLPGNVALESDMVELGVAPKQKARARQSFQRSAEIAKLGKDRLVLPAGVSLDSKPSSGGASRKMETTHTPPPTGDLDPMLATLFEDLPPSGSEWSQDARDQWLSILRRTFGRVYKDKAE
jgi:hypothetical protein